MLKSIDAEQKQCAAVGTISNFTQNLKISIH